MEEKDIAVLENNNQVVVSPKQRIQQAKDVAEACKEIVMQKSVVIQGKRHVEVEGWQTIAIGHGCTLSARNVQNTGDGYSALGEVVRISDGMVIATGEGFVGNDEKSWLDRDSYAKRAMAQTRAMSRAGRSAFAYVVVLMGGDFSTTPAEEVPKGGFNNGNKKEMPSCPKCSETLYADRQAGGYFCWKMKGGCGAKFPPGYFDKQPEAPKEKPKGDFAKVMELLRSPEIDFELLKTYESMIEARMWTEEEGIEIEELLRKLNKELNPFSDDKIPM